MTNLLSGSCSTGTGAVTGYWGFGFSTGFGFYSSFFLPPQSKQHNKSKQSKSPNKINGINHHGIPAFCSSSTVAGGGIALTTGGAYLTGVIGTDTGWMVVCSTAIGSTVTGKGITAATAPLSHFLKEIWWISVTSLMIYGAAAHTGPCWAGHGCSFGGIKDFSPSVIIVP